MGQVGEVILWSRNAIRISGYVRFRTSQCGPLAWRPSKQGFGRDDGGHLCQDVPSQSLGVRGQATMLVVSEAQAPITELFLKHAVLLA